MTTPQIAKAVAVGLVAGVMSGLFGIGGGAVMVPLLVLWLSLAQHRAHATSLAAIVLTAASGALAFARGDEIDVAAGLAIAAGAIVGAWAGAAIMHRLSPRRLRQAFSVLMLVVAVQMLIGYTPTGGVVALAGAVAVVGYVLLGLAAGALSATMGVGGGVIMVPAMVLLFGFTQHTAEGTSLLIIVPTALVGAVRHTRHGYTDWRLGALLGVAGIGGAWGGAALALGMDAELLQRLFAAFLLL
ncbi:MAG TPA: sulfite exporter TauE/SafE family protein, partial [Egibacteraceae bacterium]|nr:sulfite exporter TauE/SafE family protein [Egibacteraceae bacterium]